ncbi:MAG: hypothetical protein KKH70_20905 [Gammaproteobacteria bacterium]|nr:hypothetical protein [Gammaproteobacteria bacterium]
MKHLIDLLEETEKYLQSSLVSNQIRVVPVSYLEKVREALKTELKLQWAFAPLKDKEDLKDETVNNC